jgi:hypothetical protein
MIESRVIGGQPSTLVATHTAAMPSNLRYQRPRLKCLAMTSGCAAYKGQKICDRERIPAR